MLVCIFYLLLLNRGVGGRDTASSHELTLPQEQPTAVSPQVPDNTPCFGRSWGQDKALEALFAAVRESLWEESELRKYPLPRFGLCSASDGSMVVAILSELVNEAKTNVPNRLDVLHPTKEPADAEEGGLVLTINISPSPLLRLKPILLLILERTATDPSDLGITFSSESLDPPTQTVCLSEGTQYIILIGKPSDGAGPQKWKISVEAQSPDARQKLQEVITSRGSQNDIVTPLVLFSSFNGTDIRFSHLPGSTPASSDTFSFLCELHRFLAEALPARSPTHVRTVRLDKLTSLPPLRLGQSSSETLLEGLLNSSAPMLFSFTLGSDLTMVTPVELALSAALLQVLRQRLREAMDQLKQVMKEEDIGPKVMQKLHTLKALSGFPAEGPATGESQYRAFLLLKAAQTAVHLCEAKRGLRAARSSEGDQGGSNLCRLHSLTVSLKRFVVHPDNYDIKNCHGVCSVPLQNTNNHAVILNSQIGDGVDVGRSLCCVPVAYDELSVLEWNPGQGVSEITIRNHMVATKCGCR